ncbi:uncharacterized protein LOC129725368 isoform X2 [Wyeomyia smithii]|uniref:uncharacterized protein LOC129725368 isoform X2 n=1 Tax=Wyeomyia smithii TaxID=174621 RepID=UPI002468169E|nr:uncharacterized protein LOC129725368 isoform X2 [Wyeomyia smithii]
MSHPERPLRMDKMSPNYALKHQRKVWRAVLNKYCKLRDHEKSYLADATTADQKYNASSFASIRSTVADSGEENHIAGNQQLSSFSTQSMIKESDQQTFPEIIVNMSTSNSHQKVENWLANHFPSMELGASQAPQIVMSELNENYDRLRFQQRQNMILSKKDDEDSLLSVDTAKYILSNRNKNNSSNRVRATTTIQQFALASKRISKLRNNSKIPPAILLDACKDENSKEITKQNLTVSRHSTPDKEKRWKRRKVFKKTVKKRTLFHRKSVTSRASNGSQEFEQSLHKKCRVVKMMKSGSKQIQWIESNLRKNETETSSSEDEKIFQHKTKRSRHRRPTMSDTLNCDTSPCRKGSSSQWIEESLESIDSTLENKTPDKSHNNVTSNLSSLFAVENDNITNSTKINNATFDNVSTKTTGKSSIYKTNSVYDPSRSVLVYTPKHIDPSLPLSDRIRITVKDLDLSQVTKPRHLLEFQEFNYLVHPNSTVRFYPSDSEEDVPKPALSAKLLQMIAEDSESFDDDDPILVYNPRNLNRLNLREVLYTCD